MSLTFNLLVTTCMENKKIYLPNNYLDLLDNIKLSSDDVFKIIEPFDLSFLQTRNQSVEWGIRFPMFVDAFYDYVVKNTTVPSQQAFFDYYLSFNKLFFDEKNFDSTILDGLKARVYRTYPSLVRDLYFNKYVKENFSEANVRYNTTLDVVEGIDLMIEKNDSFYAVNLYVNTSRAYNARSKKRYRHTLFRNVNYIEFPVNFKGSLKCGNFFLYGNPEFVNLKKYICL